MSTQWGAYQNLKPEKIFLMVGVNDIIHGHDISTVGQNYASLLDKIKDCLPSADVYIESVLPTRDAKLNREVEELNSIIKQTTEEHGFVYVDLYPDLINEENILNPNYTADGIHLLGEAYQIWVNKISEYL